MVLNDKIAGTLHGENDYVDTIAIQLLLNTHKCTHQDSYDWLYRAWLL